MKSRFSAWRSLPRASSRTTCFRRFATGRGLPPSCREEVGVQVRQETGAQCLPQRPRGHRPTEPACPLPLPRVNGRWAVETPPPRPTPPALFPGPRCPAFGLWSSHSPRGAGKRASRRRRACLLLHRGPPRERSRCASTCPPPPAAVTSTSHPSGGAICARLWGITTAVRRPQRRGADPVC